MLNLLRAEVIKEGKLNFVRIVTLAPLVLAGIISLIYLVLRLTGTNFGSKPSQVATATGADLGEGVIAFSSSIVLAGFTSLYTIVLVLIAGQIINNEYSWSTIKMLATREPSRPRIILAKALFLLAYSLLMVGVFLVSWLIFAFALKIAFSDGLGLNGSDSNALGKGLAFVWPTFLTALIWAWLGLALATRFKSVVAAFILYFVYSTIDSLAAAIGVAGIKGQLNNFPDWLTPIVGILKFIAPFLINTNLVRLTGATLNPSYLESISPIQSLIVLLVWGALFIGLAILIFSRRDITD